MWVEIYYKTEQPVVINMDRVQEFYRLGEYSNSNTVVFRTGQMSVTDVMIAEFKSEEAAIRAVANISNGLRNRKPIILIGADDGEEIQ